MDFWIIILVALLCSAVGFFMYIYFFSVGYGLAIAGIGVTFLIGFNGRLQLPEIIICCLFVIYGLRLGLYLLIRDSKNKAYRKLTTPERERGHRLKIGYKLLIWVSCALLYYLETCPVYFRLNNGAPVDAMLWVGIVIMVIGMILEIIADIQKNSAKKKHPGRFVDAGLYRLVRCPNYLGEVLIWLGVLLSGITALEGAGQVIAAVLGFALIVYVMLSGARRLELRQDKNYGNDPEYQKYVKSVPILFPFIPLYSVKKYKIFSA